MQCPVLQHVIKLLQFQHFPEISASTRLRRFSPAAGFSTRLPIIFRGTFLQVSTLLHISPAGIRAADHRTPWPRQCLQVSLKPLQTAFLRRSRPPPSLVNWPRRKTKAKTAARPAVIWKADLSCFNIVPVSKRSSIRLRPSVRCKRHGSTSEHFQYNENEECSAESAAKDQIEQSPARRGEHRC